MMIRRSVFQVCDILEPPVNGIIRVHCVPFCIPEEMDMDGPWILHDLFNWYTDKWMQWKAFILYPIIDLVVLYDRSV